MLANEAVRNTVSSRDRLSQSIEQAIKRLQNERQVRPESTEILEEAIDKLIELGSRASDSDAILDLLAGIFDQETDLGALLGEGPEEDKARVEYAHRDIIDLTALHRTAISDPSQAESSLKSRLQELERYAKEHAGEGIAAYALELFPELRDRLSAPSIAASTLPDAAPEIYQGLRGPETPPAFVKRVYGEWLGHGLTRAHIRKLDPTLYTAIDNWSRKNAWPADVDLPTLKEQNDRDVARLGASEGREILGQFTGKEAARLGAAIARRTK